MKKILFTMLMVLIMVGGMTGLAEARIDACFWVWSVDVTGVDDNDAPDYVYCQINGSYMASMGATYIQETSGAKQVMVQYDSLFGDGSNTVGALHAQITNTDVMPDAAATNWDINVLGCWAGTCDTGSGTAAYYQWNDLTTNLKDTVSLTPPAGGFQLTVDGDVEDAAPVIRTLVIW